MSEVETQNSAANADLRGFQVNPTLEGYTLVSDDLERRDRWMSLGRKILGGMLLMIIFALWVMGSTGDSETLALKFGATFFLLIGAAMVLNQQAKPIRRELQVNLERGELRSGWRGDNRELHLEAVHAFDDIEVVTICTIEGGDENAVLVLRLAGSESAVVAALGTKVELEPYKIKLAHDLGAYAGGIDPVGRVEFNKKVPLVLGPRVGAADAAA